MAETSPPASASLFTMGPWPNREREAHRSVNKCQTTSHGARKRGSERASEKKANTCPGSKVHGGAAEGILVVGVWRQAVWHREHSFHVLHSTDQVGAHDAQLGPVVHAATTCSEEQTTHREVSAARSGVEGMRVRHGDGLTIIRYRRNRSRSCNAKSWGNGSTCKDTARSH